MSHSIFKQFRSPYGTYVPRYIARNRWAIGDIHGCASTFDSLLKEIDFQKKDQLFLLGDYINKGPDSVGVLERILSLKKEGFEVHPIRGNHEEIFLDYCGKKRKSEKSGKKYNLRNKMLTPELIDQNDRPISRYLEFFENLPYYCETADFFTVHTNFNFKAKKPFHEKESMLYSLDYKVDPKWVGEKVVLHGHMPYDLEDIQQEVAARSPSINLDNGCVLALQPEKYRPGIGNLCALNMDSYELVAQRNID